MAAMNGNPGGLASEINVTPMIDVLLVLLIIFMVIVPAIPRGEPAMLPRPSNSLAPSDPVVLEVFRNRNNLVNFRINQQPVGRLELQARLAAVFSNRAERILFLKGDDRLSFTDIAEAIDASRAAGIDHVGLMTPGTATR